MAKPKWDSRVYKENELVMSPSQLENYLQCPRKWWFNSIRKMPELEQKKDNFDFGNVLHEAAARWISADDTGRDHNGQPVDLFPDGWDVQEGRKLSPADVVSRIERWRTTLFIK
jgi:CRISPR/Cas system-associated exonuclease Cas4 (RecB family)